MTSALAFLVSGVSLAVALVTVSLNVRAVRKTDLEILKLKLDLEEASSRIYVPTSKEITRLMETIRVSEEISRNLNESAREHLSYYQTSNQQSPRVIESMQGLEDSIRCLEARLSSVVYWLEQGIYLEKNSD
ncbi:hypothetical protein N9F21_00355 [Porticoccaceae bacterium]|nr:hypothetical protein [Porticoccaceae bacterium]